MPEMSDSENEFSDGSDNDTIPEIPDMPESPKFPILFWGKYKGKYPYGAVKFYNVIAAKKFGDVKYYTMTLKPDGSITNVHFQRLRGYYYKSMIKPDGTIEIIAPYRRLPHERKNNLSNSKYLRGDYR